MRVHMWIWNVIAYWMLGFFMNYAMLCLGYVIEMSGLDILRDGLLHYARRLTGFDRYTTNASP